MKTKLWMAAWILVLAGCANSSFKVPLSTDEPPPPNAAVDAHCMEDCLSDGSDAEICHARCAK